jgi:hypothetical protein
MTTKVYTYDGNGTDIADIAALAFTGGQFLDVENRESISSVC